MALLVVINLVKTVLQSQYFYQLGLVGLQMRSALTSMLFRKALLVGPSARKNLTGNFPLH